MDYYTARTLALASGVSRERLRRWSRSGHLRPTEQQRGRQWEWGYTWSQAIGVCALGRIRCDISARQLGRAAAMLPMAIPAAGYLIFDGRMMTVAVTGEQALERLLNAPGPSWGWDVRALDAELRRFA